MILKKKKLFEKIPAQKLFSISDAHRLYCIEIIALAYKGLVLLVSCLIFKYLGNNCEENQNFY